MHPFQSLIKKMKRRNHRFRGSVEKLLAQVAGERDLLLLHQEVMVVSRQRDFCAAAAILPHRRVLPGEGEDFIFLYLDLEEMDMEPGFYTVRLFKDEYGTYLRQAQLVDAKGRFVQSCRFLQVDPHLSILGKRFSNESRNVLLDSWIRRGEAYAVEGVMGTGTPFVITLEF